MLVDPRRGSEPMDRQIGKSRRTAARSSRPLYDEHSRSTMIFGEKASVEGRVERAPQAAELGLWDGTM
jgi:hypothetical protein